MRALPHPQSPHAGNSDRAASPSYGAAVSPSSPKLIITCKCVTARVTGPVTLTDARTHISAGDVAQSLTLTHTRARAHTSLSAAAPTATGQGSASGFLARGVSLPAIPRGIPRQFPPGMLTTYRSEVSDRQGVTRGRRVEVNSGQRPEKPEPKKPCALEAHLPECNSERS